MENLKINDIFWTFQGEGRWAGRRALFVRLPHCNLSCSWCDTEFDTFKEYSQNAFVTFCKQEETRFVVLTGGEPMMNKQLPEIIRLLKNLGFYIAVESNGTFPYVKGIDWVTCSPKRDAAYKVHRDFAGHVDEYKYVVDEGFTFEILTRHDRGERYYNLAPKARLSLSPEFNEMEKNLEKIIKHIKKDSRWNLNLQTHKWIGVK